MTAPEQFERSEWRLLRHPAASGAWNMAVDKTLLQRVGQGRSRPVLRLYGWDPPCLSLGYAQKVKDVDQAALEALGWDLVRRPTGGKAILHADELTYAVIAPHDEPRLSGGVLNSYRILAGPLLQALQSLGIDARISGKAPPCPNPGPVCFEVPSDFEITVGGKKIVGSAQARRKGGILQHGTFPLHGDLTRIHRILAYPDELARQHAAERLLRRATTTQNALGAMVPFERAADQFIKAFQEVLNLRLVASVLTSEERAAAEQLAVEAAA